MHLNRNKFICALLLYFCNLNFEPILKGQENTEKKMNKEPHKSLDLSSSRMNYGKQTWIWHEVGFQIQKV